MLNKINKRINSLSIGFKIDYKTIPRVPAVVVVTSVVITVLSMVVNAVVAIVVLSVVVSTETVLASLAFTNKV